MRRNNPGGGVTVSDVSGTWWGKEVDAYVRYHDDGTYQISLTVDGLTTAPIEQGRFELDGNALTFISSAASQNCNEGEIGHWRVEFIDADLWRLHRIDEECANRGRPSVVTHERQP